MNIVFKLICQAAEEYISRSNRQDKESRLLLKKFEFIKEQIKMNRTYGEVIKKNNLEKNRDLLNAFFQRYNHSELYNLDTCFCCDMTRTNWRLLYTIMRDQKEDILYIFCFMIIDHKTYIKYFA